MDFNKLIELVTKEVIKKIKESGIQLMESKPEIQEKNLLFLGEKESAAYKFYDHDLKAFGYKLYSSEENSLTLNSYEGIIIPELSVKELSNIGIGASSSQREEIIINAMLQGIPVYLLEEGLVYRQFAKTANKVFFKMFSEYEDKLISYGMKIKKMNEISNVLKNEKEKGTLINVIDGSGNLPVIKEENEEKIQKKTINSNIVTKKLISEMDVRELFREGIREIFVSKKTLITPLAKDFARINHMEIKKEM